VSLAVEQRFKHGPNLSRVCTDVPNRMVQSSRQVAYSSLQTALGSLPLGLLPNASHIALQRTHVIGLGTLSERV